MKEEFRHSSFYLRILLVTISFEKGWCFMRIRKRNIDGREVFVLIIKSTGLESVYSTYEEAFAEGAKIVIDSKM